MALAAYKQTHLLCSFR